VLFSPEDLRLVKDGPAERRRFMDIELSQLSASYFYALQQYNRVLKERNALLRQLPMQPYLIDTLPAWDEQFCRLAAEIYTFRAAFMQQLSALAYEVHHDLAGGKEELQARFISDGGDETHYRTQLEKCREQDLRRMTSYTGPHHDDIELELNGMSVRAFGSQGQQRTAALALKLSELRLMQARTGDAPILLLDDVLSELDSHRRRQLMEHTGGVQVLITCTQASSIPQIESRHVEMMTVRAGEVFPEGAL